MTVTVIGVDGGTLAPGSASIVDKASLVIGTPEHLAAHAPATARRIELGQWDTALAALAERAGQDGEGTDAVVLAAGDPGYFGILRVLRDAGIEALVRPALTGVQRLAALAGRPWDDVTVVSAHGRHARQALNACRARRAVAVLTEPSFGPAEIGAGLAGWRRTLLVAEDLGGPFEQLSLVEAGQAAGRSWQRPNVVLSLADTDPRPVRAGWCAGGAAGTPPDRGWALPDDEFALREGTTTTAEVRALVLARLAPRLGTLVWDIGAGAGAVGVECARMGAAVVAVERDPGQGVRIVANAARHGVDVQLVDGTAPAALAGLPEPDAIFVGGGGPDVVRACAEVGAPRIVVSFTSLDRLAPVRNSLRWAGYQVDGCQLIASRLLDLTNRASRLAPADPVLVLWGERA